MVTFDGISVDFTKMEVNRNGELVVLTAQEFKTLKFLIQNAERVISRDELLNEVWGYQNYPSTRTVDNHILEAAAEAGKEIRRIRHISGRFMAWVTSLCVDSQGGEGLRRGER